MDGDKSLTRSGTSGVAAVERSLTQTVTGDDLARIERAVGVPPDTQYECIHVYPLSVPDFRQSAGERPYVAGRDPVKLYIHVPFCNYACHFCFYVKRTHATSDMHRDYCEAIRLELQAAAAHGVPVSQLYVGGGTPTALPAEILERLLTDVLEYLPALNGASLCVETSPESLTPQHCVSFNRLGINRVSVGIDTLNDQLLSRINRRHTADQAISACSRLLDSGVRVNADLIYGFAGQTHASFEADMGRVAALGVHSLTLYNLRVNELAPLGRSRTPRSIDLLTLIEWRALAARSASKLGYEQTRCHTFERKRSNAVAYVRAPCVDGYGPGRQIGLGPSAVSHLGLSIYRNEMNIDAYFRRASQGENVVTERRDLDRHDRSTLFVARTLGDRGVLPKQAYRDSFGSDFRSEYGARLDELAEAGLIHEDASSVELSSTGRLVHDLITLTFYPEGARRWLSEHQQPF